MPAYAVNVRAIVDIESLGTEEIAVPGWEVYDVSTVEDEGPESPAVKRVRCDRPETVEAEDEAAAIEAAKAAAPEIKVPDWHVVSVRLWVDEDIDVEPAKSPAP